MQGGFVTCLCRDGRGSVFVGTEDFGVWRYSASSPAGHQWTQFHGKEDYGQDSCYALCCDALGRVWCGGLHGLSVFSGGQWRHFTPLNGPLGYRVFALTTSPVDGDIWGATEAGLFRYSLSQNTWTYYTTLDGLPTDAIQSLCFDAKGLLYVGTQADGLCLSSAASNFHDWAKVPGPASMPSAPTGEGLPSSLINCLYAARDGTIYAGTNCGLAGSRDNGQTWHFLRGADWKAKVLGLYHGPVPHDIGTRSNLLTEDYVTCVSEDSAGRLWVGHRQKSVEVRDERTGRRLPTKTIAKTIGGAFVTALLPTPDGTMLVGGYGSGLTQAGLAAQGGNLLTAKREAVAPSSSLPTYAKPPTLSELNDLLAQVAQVKPETAGDKPLVVALHDDWQTEGNWLGRYGRYWANLCAMASLGDSEGTATDYLWGAGWENINYVSRSGPNSNADDALRYWVHWLYTTNPGSLEMPLTYLDSRVSQHLTTWKVNRREAEVDDHGESYSTSKDGPHVYCTLTVPKGLYYLSLYEFNKDGHGGLERDRDYRVSIRPHTGDDLNDLSGFASQPELAHGRVKDFWGGVWKRFLVRGPQTLTIEVNRNNSQNTILPGVTLDLVDEDPAPYFQTVAQWQAREDQRTKDQQGLLTETPEAHAQRFLPGKSERDAANRLFDALQAMRLTNAAWWAENGPRFYGLLGRWFQEQYDAASSHATPRLLSRLGTCDYALGLYPQWEQCQQQAGLQTARQIEKSLRWDGVSGDGEGYQVVTDYLAAQKNSPKSRPAREAALSRSGH